MNKFNEIKINKLIWGISTITFCLLIYFACLPFYKRDLNYFTGSIVLALIALVFTVSLILVCLLISYVMALFLIDCLRLSHQALIKNKVTGFLTILSFLIIIVPPIINLRKLSNIGALYTLFLFLLIFPMTVILLSRFVLQKIKKYPFLLGFASLIAFDIFGFLYLNNAGIEGGDSGGPGLIVLIESIAVCLISIVVNFMERIKIKTIQGE